VPVSMSIEGKLVDGADSLRPYLAAWDAMATAASQPYCAPAWMLAWWRHAAPRGAQLRVVLGLDGDRLVGVAPFCVVQDRLRLARYRLLASGRCSPIGPLAVEGMEDELARVFSRALAQARPSPRLIALEGIAAGSPWPALLARAWPGAAPQLLRHWAEPVPTVSLDGVESLDQWLGSKSAHFRREMRRTRRRLLATGAVFRLAETPEEVERGLDAFAGLHYANWSSRGGSAALDPAVEHMLRDAARALLDAGRFRVWSVEVDGATVAGRVTVAAGGELAFWASGFDEAWAKYSPSMQSSLTAIEDAVGRGERRIMLGPGSQEWKYRLADGEDAVESVTLVPAGALSSAARARLGAEGLRRALSERVPPDVKARIKAGVRAARRRSR
jgi:CelD/BcsL family acetyltransferase involved in cellulose biosynthesis